MKAGNSRIKVIGDVESGEGLLPGLQTADFLLYLHTVERELASFLASCYKATISIHENPTLMT